MYSPEVLLQKIGEMKAVAASKVIAKYNSSPNPLTRASLLGNGRSSPHGLRMATVFHYVVGCTLCAGLESMNKPCQWLTFSGKIPTAIKIRKLGLPW